MKLPNPVNYVAAAESLLETALNSLDPTAQLTPEARRDMIQIALLAALIALVKK